MLVLCSVCVCIYWQLFASGIFQVCLVDITDLEWITQLKETLATVLSVSENCRFHAAEKEARTVPHLSRFCWVWRLAISMNDLFRCDFGIDLLVNLRWKLFVAGVSGLEHAATGSHFYLNRMIKSPRYHGQEALRQSAPLPESYLWVAPLQFVKNLWPLFWGVVFGFASVSLIDTSPIRDPNCCWSINFQFLKYLLYAAVVHTENALSLCLRNLSMKTLKRYLCYLRLSLFPASDQLVHRCKDSAPALGWGVPSREIRSNQPRENMT